MTKTQQKNRTHENIPIIRYAEVLLSYLEAGEAITQDLLNKTINTVRNRPSVQMPRVTETSTGKLRTILGKQNKSM